MKINIHRTGRAATVVALGSVLALTATACGDNGSGAAGDKGTEGSGKGEITFWDNNGGVRTDIWKQIIADFEKKYPDIKVKYVGIPAASAQSKYDTAIQGGGLPTSAVWVPRCSPRSPSREPLSRWTAGSRGVR